MHDWVLVNVLFLWEQGGQCNIELRNSDSQPRFIIAKNVSKLLIPRYEDWGPSASVNNVRRSSSVEGASLEIEMQSGDVILVEASDIVMDW